jgi:hypothetical protein
MKILLLLGFSFFLAGCGRSDEPTAPEPPPSLSLPNPESMEFADFLKAAALISRNRKVTFRHPQLPVPIQFSSWPPNDGDLIDPLAIQLIGEEIRDEGELMDAAALEAWTKKTIEVFKLVHEPARVMILASEDPPVIFQDGLKVLRILAENGIDEIVLARPESNVEQTARIERELRRERQVKPSPSAPPAR